MKQLALIAEPRARHDNPHTSKAAAQSVAPAASYLESQIVACVARGRYPITAEGIAELVGFDHPDRWTVGSIVTAVSRCASRGLIVPSGFGVTSRNRQAVAYLAAS